MPSVAAEHAVATDGALRRRDRSDVETEKQSNRFSIYVCATAKAQAVMQREERLPKFRMKRVAVPAWARWPDTHLDTMWLSDYQTIQQRRQQLLDVVHREVETYLNTPGLYGESGGDMFPDRSRMSGEYYLGDESYTGHVGPVWIQVGIMCRCLEKPSRPGQENRDYLGLEVWLRCDPADWSFTVFRKADSSSI